MHFNENTNLLYLNDYGLQAQACLNRPIYFELKPFLIIKRVAILIKSDIWIFIIMGDNFHVQFPKFWRSDIDRSPPEAERSQ